jgi:hypothetical protein
MRGLKCGGRQRGTPNKTTREIRELARVEGPACIEMLAAFRDDDTKPPAARIEACKVLLDRGYGRSTMQVQIEATVTHDYYGLTTDELAARAEQLARALRGEEEAKRLLLEAPAALDGEVVDDTQG